MLYVFNPDVLLIDIAMPHLSGYEIMEKLRHLPVFKNIIAIAVTGYGQKEDQQRTSLAGFHFHMVKPVDIDQLGLILSGAVTPSG
jgi:CheY-like chemotaxis protein